LDGGEKGGFVCGWGGGGGGGDNGRGWLRRGDAACLCGVLPRGNLRLGRRDLADLS